MFETRCPGTQRQATKWNVSIVRNYHKKITFFLSRMSFLSTAKSFSQAVIIFQVLWFIFIFFYLNHNQNK